MEKNNALLIVRPEDLQNVKLFEAWAKLRGCVFSEATTQLRKSWGILAEDLTTEQAARYGEVLKTQGLEVKTLPVNSLVSPSLAAPVKTLAFSSDALIIHTAAGEKSLAWSALEALFAFALTESSIKKTKVTEGPSAAEKIVKTGLMLATGLPIPIGKKKTVEKTVKQSELYFYLDLIESKNSRYRIDGQHLDYGFLGPGKEMGSQSNYRLLFDELKKRAPHAFLNKGARILTAHQPVSTMGYDSLADIDRESKWFLSR